MTVQEPRRLSIRTAFASRWLSVLEEVVEDPNGAVSWFFVDHPGCALVVPTTTDGLVGFVNIWRPSVRRWCRELPAGRVDTTETPETAARRELREELGGECDRMHHLGTVFASTGSSNEAVHIFAATEVRVGSSCPDERERISVEFLPSAVAIEYATNGMIHDGPSALALLWAASAGCLGRPAGHTAGTDDPGRHVQNG